MDKKILNIGERKQPFVLAFEESTALPAWMTTMDEMWVQLAGDGLFNMIKDHPLYCINSNTSNKKNFAASMTIDNFKSILAIREAAMFKDYVFALLDTLITQCPVPNPSARMYVSFFSGSSNHVVNCMLELDKGLIMFGAELD